MANAVLTQKPTSRYDDEPGRRYHFPHSHRYLETIQAAVGDQVVFYEPRRSGPGETTGGRKSYVAVARVVGIDPDPARDDHSYARIEDCIPFDRPVPFRRGSHFFETALRKPDGSVSLGRFRPAVRALSTDELELILREGFGPTLEALRDPLPPIIGPEPPAVDLDRPIAELITRRPVRDEVFARAVRQAYDATCAFTGMRIVNGGGRAEAEAAHIRPVADKGPDLIQNGLCLSRTAHWLFDRNLITVTDDFHIKVAAKLVPKDVLRMLRLDRPIIVPKSSQLWPHRVFLEFHRARFEAKVKALA